MVLGRTVSRLSLLSVSLSVKLRLKRRPFNGERVGYEIFFWTVLFCLQVSYSCGSTVFLHVLIYCNCVRSWAVYFKLHDVLCFYGEVTLLNFWYVPFNVSHLFHFILYFVCSVGAPTTSRTWRGSCCYCWERFVWWLLSSTDFDVFFPQATCCVPH